MWLGIYVFFFKQKTAYEMRISDWSSDVCSSDLAQSRAKALAKMQPIAAALEDPSLSFAFPDPPELRPPLITLDMAAVGYDERAILQRLNLRLDPDDRIALRSEEHTSELQSLMRTSYAVFCLKNKTQSLQSE